jgi:hypothetical protein
VHATASRSPSGFGSRPFLLAGLYGRRFPRLAFSLYSALRPRNADVTPSELEPSSVLCA